MPFSSLSKPKGESIGYTNVIPNFEYGIDGNDFVILDVGSYKNFKVSKLLTNYKLKYCDKKEYEFVWFCKDVEQVYLGDKVVDDRKKKTAAKFKERKMILKVSQKQLSANNFRANSSNIMLVLDRIGELKRSIT